MTVRVAINGFGRIGRQVFKIIHQRYPDELRITHIGVSNPHATENRALLLKYDSNYGIFDAEVEANVRGGNNCHRGRRPRDAASSGAIPTDRCPSGAGWASIWSSKRRGTLGGERTCI